jgi:NDP-sugar pyrophosphorylase family protein
MGTGETLAAAILAGGLGTRLRAILPAQPKVMADVGGRPFVTQLLAQLRVAGFRRAVLCIGHLGDQIRNRLGEQWEGVTLDYSSEPAPLGTAGALRLAAERFDADPVLVVNGDSYCDADLARFRSDHERRKAIGTLLLAHLPSTARYGRVQCDLSGAIRRFEEKSDADGPGWINAGYYLLSRELIAEIPAGRAVSLEREMFPAWIGRSFYGHACEGRFLDIGVPADLASAPAFFNSLARDGRVS